MSQWLFGKPTTKASAQTGFIPPSVEERELLLPETPQKTNYTVVTDSLSEHVRAARLESNQRRLRRSSSDQNLRQLHDRDHSISSLSHEQTDSAMLQQRLALATLTRSSNPSPLSWHRSTPTRSISDYSSSSPVPPVTKHRAVDLPLKPCMKQASKSAAGTPPSDEYSQSISETGPMIRRVKTVDFDEPVSRNRQETSPTSVLPETTAPQHSVQVPQAKKTLRGITPFPGPRAKSTPADAATTRTDVHVVAVAPSGHGKVPGDVSKATPTMQMVESNAGRYEIIWDNVPPDEDDMPRNRRNSSASQALYAATSSEPKSLERVNSKLTEWAWGGEVTSSPFKPQIVVFPDDDGRTRRFECAVEEDDMVVIAPPNSLRPSATPSRIPSQPGSARVSRETSEEDEYTDAHRKPEPHSFDRGHPKLLPTTRKEETELLSPTDHFVNYSRPRTQQATGREARKPVGQRRLSNMEDSEIKFRGHRDSVTLARSRIANSGELCSDLLIHGDSVAMVKKRMHARNHAISSARNITAPSKLCASEPATPLDTD